MDNRKNNGGHKTAGRKPKSEEIALIEALTPYDEIARQQLIKGVKEGSYNHLRLFYEYRYGKPKQMIDITTMGEQIKQVFKIGNQEIEL